MLQTLWQFRSPSMRITLGDRTVERRVFLVAVANCASYGGGMRIAPDAVPDDGLFDVCVVGDLSRLAVLRLIPKLYSGGHRSHPAVELVRCREVHAQSSVRVRCQADGELVGDLPASFRIHPGGLRCVTGPRSAAECRVTLGTFADVLRWRAAEQPEATAFSWLGGDPDHDVVVDLTYAELDRRARAIGALLQQEGPPGERALLLFAPGLDFVAALFGCFYAGWIAVPAYPPPLNQRLGRIQSVARDAQPLVALTSASLLAQVRGRVAGEPDLEHLRWRSIDDITATTAATADWVPAHLEPGALAVLQYTSGSTAAPRGVMLTHANLLHNTAQIEKRFGIVDTPRESGRDLVAALPRHGPGRRHPRRRLRRFSDQPHGAGGVSPAAATLVGSHHPHPRHHQRRTELRLRPVRRPHSASRAGWPGPVELAGRVQWLRTGARDDPAALRGGLRSVRFSADGLLPVLRTGRGDAHGRPAVARPRSPSSRP